jgi:hypothetical protein
MATSNPNFPDFCLDQADRLGVFRDWGFMGATARAEYSSFLIRRCGTAERVTRLMDAAILLEEMPTLAGLNHLWNELFGVPPPPWSVEMSGEEREEQKQFMRDWRAHELAGIEERRASFKRYQDRYAAGKTSDSLRPITATRNATPFEMDDAVKSWMKRWHDLNDPK